jgi:hypothetical protein
MIQHLSPLSRQQVVSLSQSSSVSPVQLTEGGVGGWRGAKSYDRAKTWTLYKSFNILCLHDCPGLTESWTILALYLVLHNFTACFVKGPGEERNLPGSFCPDCLFKADKCLKYCRYLACSTTCSS